MGDNWLRGQLWERAVTGVFSTHTHPSRATHTHTHTHTHTLTHWHTHWHTHTHTLMTCNGLYHPQSEWRTNKRILLTQVGHWVCVCVCARTCVCVSKGEIWAAEGSQQVGAQWRGGQGGGLRVANLGGRRDGTQCDLSTAICSSINHGRIYTHRLTLCSVWGQGRGYFRVWGRGGVGLRQDRGKGGGVGGEGVPLPETGVGLKLALWAATYHCTTGGVWVIHRTAFSIRDFSQGQGLTTNTLSHCHTHTQGTEHKCTRWWACSWFTVQVDRSSDKINCHPIIIYYKYHDF